MEVGVSDGGVSDGGRCILWQVARPSAHLLDPIIVCLAIFTQQYLI